MNRSSANKPKTNKKIQNAKIVNKELPNETKKKLCPDRLITCLKTRIKQIAKQKKIRTNLSLTEAMNRDISTPDESFDDQSTAHSLKCDKKKLKIDNRIEQLAYPQVRKLIETKKKCKTFLKDKDQILNRLLNESQSSYYSQLANIKPIEKSSKPPKWTDQEWKKHKRIAKKLAQPKKLVQPPPVEKVVKPIRELEESIEKLSKPRIKIEEKPYIQKWKLSAKLKDYEPSKRIRELGRPVERYTAVNYKDPTKIEPAALNYIPTDRIVELAKTKKYYEIMETNRFKIPQKVLTAKPTDRIIELAKPKSNKRFGRKWKKTKKIRPTNVSKKALMAIPTNRILQLAKPRDQ